MENLETLFKTLEKEKHYVGLALWIEQNGKTVFKDSFGYRSLKTKSPIQDDTIYHLYSMSKALTASAILLLEERKQLSLKDPLSHYYPSFAHPLVVHGKGSHPAKREILLQDLLDMSSGLPYPDESVSGKAVNSCFNALIARLGSAHEMTTQEFVESLSSCPLVSEPGEEWHYGLSADILGGVVEKVSGMRFSSFLKKEFFDPLGMKDTAFFIPLEKKDRLCTIYEMPGATYPSLTKPEEYHGQNIGITDFTKEPSFLSGGAGLYSTLGDYHRFLSMLLNDGVFEGKRILSKEAIHSFQKNHYPTPLSSWPSLSGYGYANLMRVLVDPALAQIPVAPGEYGWDGWSGPYFAIDPKKKTILLAMTGTLGYDPSEDRRRIKRALY
jgi:CubicO group peptidase (beta-lactamase class C family)